MPYKHRDTFRRSLPRYIQTMKERRLSETYIAESKRVLLRARDTLDGDRRLHPPSKMPKADILFYLDSLKGSSKYRQQRFLTFCQFLKFCGNDAITDLNLRFPRDGATKADWLEQEQIPYVREKGSKDPQLNLILELGLNNFARRVEIKRFTVADAKACIETGVISLLGKGPMGGRTRSFYCHPDTPAVLEKYLEHRAKLLNGCNQPVEDPPELLIYVRDGIPRSYSNSGMDRIMNRFSKAIGVHIKFHTSRRTGLRQMHFAGVELPTMQRIAGHQSVDMTVRYIGIRLQDTAAAMTKYAAYQEQGAYSAATPSDGDR